MMNRTLGLGAAIDAGAERQIARNANRCFMSRLALLRTDNTGIGIRLRAGLLNDQERNVPIGDMPLAVGRGDEQAVAARGSCGAVNSIWRQAGSRIRPAIGCDFFSMLPA